MVSVGCLGMSVGCLILVLLLGEPGEPGRIASWEGEKGGMVLWVLLWVWCCEFIFICSLCYTALSKRGQLRCRQTLSALRAAPPSAELMLAAGSGACAAWAAGPALQWAPGTFPWGFSHSSQPLRPLRAAVSCNQRWASSLPAASAPSTAVQPWAPNHLCCTGGKFWERARQKSRGSSYAGALLTGIKFLQGSQKPYTGILQLCLISRASYAQQCRSFTTL